MNSMIPPIEFDRKKALQFLKVYTDTRNTRGEVFMFEGIEFQTGYAMYILEYLVVKGLLKEGEIK